MTTLRFNRVNQSIWRRRIPVRGSAFTAGASAARAATDTLAADLKMFAMTFVAGFLGVTIFFA
ncbi:hypothetical protein HMF7854_10550 [Sphingomonas ginkgonis]|uniref:Uncharacterized protein n=1 Tax=Sphingomonas ginkgonis TaxID=2315330 RepID=A0A429VBG9_9SPHN|nr:hypothetical protein [Sphingomonas ginkgonis]RST31226.1 hypothetical protein HMF7854_10550 [Sphingomonas ginkgonis]